ncbi:MAG: hypothetical protein CW691_10110, partial [Candidatus Bathyarchaeum sp.]
MQINKKIYSTLIISLLALSMIAVAIPMVSAIAGPPALFATPAFGTPVTEVTGGPVGSRVSIIANSTHGTPAAPFTLVTAYWDSLTGKVLGTVSADVNGYFRIDAVIPSAITGDHYVIVKDSGDAAYAVYTVVPIVTAASVPPVPGPVRVLPGDSLTVTGHGYAPGDEMTITLVATGSVTNTVTITTPVVETNSTGSFTATIVIPAIAAANYSTYDVTAEDEAAGSDTFEINIDYYIILTPNGGPTGITTVIAGRIPASKAYEVRFNAAPIATGTSSATGTYSESYAIPSVLSTGTYEVMIVWDTSINRTADFEVTAPPTITLGATTGVAGTVVTINGFTFSRYATITLYFGTTVVNSTAMDSRFGPTSAATGNFAEEFVVPALTPGVYAVKVVDQYGATTQPIYTFVITPTPVTTVALNGAAYMQGDALSFTFRTTETSITAGPVCVIRSPAGVVYWSGAAWTLTTSGVTMSVLYQDQLFNGNPAVLPADAPLGAWNWTITYTPISTGVSTKATGVFSVSAPATLDAIMTKLDDVQGNITEAITTSEGVIINNLNGLDAKLTSITNSIASISTTVGTINTAVSNLNIGTLGSDVMEIAGDVATIQTSLGALTADLDAIGLEVTDISGTVATIETDLGTLSGTVTSIDDGVATIETEVGTVKADVQGLSEVDMTPVWIAVVLSLVA